MRVGLIVLALFMLTGCGKTYDQILKTGHDLIDVAGKTYEDVKDNVETAKKIVLPASPANP